MEVSQTKINNLVSIGDKTLKSDTGILISFIDTAILDWRKLTTLTSIIDELINDLDNISASHYLSAAADRLKDIQEILLLEKGKVDIKDSKFPRLTQPMRVALILEIRRFKEYYLLKVTQLNQGNVLE